MASSAPQSPLVPKLQRVSERWNFILELSLSRHYADLDALEFPSSSMIPVVLLLASFLPNLGWNFENWSFTQQSYWAFRVRPWAVPGAVRHETPDSTPSPRAPSGFPHSAKSFVAALSIPKRHGIKGRGASLLLSEQLTHCEINGKTWVWWAYYAKELCSILLGMIMTCGYFRQYA